MPIKTTRALVRNFIKTSLMTSRALCFGKEKVLFIPKRGDLKKWAVLVRPRHHRSPLSCHPASQMNGDFNVDTHKQTKKSPPVSCPHPTIQKETQPNRPAFKHRESIQPLVKVDPPKFTLGGRQLGWGSRRASHKEPQPDFKVRLWTSTLYFLFVRHTFYSVSFRTEEPVPPPSFF